MAHLLIAAANGRYRRTLAELLIAAGHHLVTTSEIGLAYAALRLSTRGVIALLADAATATPDACSLLDIAARVEQARRESFDTQHAYILLTQRPCYELSSDVRNLFTTSRVEILPPDCSIGTLLTAVEVATAWLAENAVALTRPASAPPPRRALSCAPAAAR